MNSCNDCRWVKKASSKYAGVGYFYCKRHYKLHPLYGKMIMSCEDVRFNNNHCDDWEQGGLKGLFQRLEKDGITSQRIL